MTSATRTVRCMADSVRRSASVNQYRPNGESATRA